MRRSGAPSVKKLENPAIVVPLAATKPKITQLPTRNINISSTEVQKPLNENCGKIIFNVTWGKLSTKKHKTWEGDGTLQVTGRYAVLRDETGKILGSSSVTKPEELLDGSRLIIGTKEVELQERINKLPKFSTEKIEQTEENIEEPPEKKTNSNVSSFLNLSTPHQKRLNLNGALGREDEMVLPTPSYEHQWTYNDARLPLAEVTVSNSLSKHLRPHQRRGVVFLYECLLGFRNKNHFGAILADEMGLGKTLQCLTVCHTLLKKGPYGGQPILTKILIVVPSSLTDSWSKEVEKWLGGERLFAYVVDSKHPIKKYSGQSHTPFVVVSYEMLVKHCDDFETFNFDLVICDEGHRLKNSAIKVATSLRQLNIKRKVILSGTPIQNDLEEFYALVDFVNPGVLGSYQEYRFEFEMPIVRSQAPDADDEVVAIGNQKALKLSEVTNSFILRRTQAINEKYLPKKEEFIVFVRPTELQQFLLSKVLAWYEARGEEGTGDVSSLQIITQLKKICSSPGLIETTTRKDSPLIQYLIDELSKWKKKPFDSGKLNLVRNFLQDATSTKEKVVLVSNYTKTLDVLMNLCQHLNLKYLRLDGSTQSSDRQGVVDKFNRGNLDFSVFLLSSKAGGVGLNLCGASRLVLFDNDWNPATDHQAMSRIWRDGQSRDVKIYRLVTAGTIEEKIFQRQVAKTTLGGCVMENTKTGNSMKFSADELKDLFSLETNFESCATHEILKCDCNGRGNNVVENTHEDQAEEDPFQIVLTNPEDCGAIKINELKQWQHYSYPIESELLKETCLSRSAGEILFIFRNKNSKP